MVSPCGMGSEWYPKRGKPHKVYYLHCDGCSERGNPKRMREICEKCSPHHLKRNYISEYRTSHLFFPRYFRECTLLQRNIVFMVKDIRKYKDDIIYSARVK